MGASVFKETTRNKLLEVSVATLATALFKRGLRNQTIQAIHPVSPKGRNMVGPAFTLRYIPAREDLNQLTEFRKSDHPQRVAIETCPAGSVLVFDSLKDPRAASAGDILITRLQQRGVAGVVTDGGFRDAMKIAELKIPAYHQRPISPTNLTLHQALDLNVPIGCGDTAVFPGDIIVGDDDCVIVIPAYLTEEIVEEAVEMTAACRFCRGESSKRSIHHWTLSSYKRGESGGVCKVAREEWPLGFILSNQSRNI